jgi:hypothetical protein
VISGKRILYLYLENGWKVDLLGSGGAISAVHRNYRSCSSHVRFNLKFNNKKKLVILIWLNKFSLFDLNYNDLE